MPKWNVESLIKQAGCLSPVPRSRFKRRSHSPFALLAFCVFSFLMGCELNIRPQRQNLTPFAQSWPFDPGTDANYAFDPSRIDLNGGVCRLSKADQVDSDNSAGGFAGAVLTGAFWDTSNSVIRLSQTGTARNDSELDSSWAPQWSSLTAYYKLNSDWNDSKGSNHLTAYNSPIFSAASKIGVGAASFNGTTQYADIAGAFNYTTESFTISLWAKPATLTGSSGQELVLFSKPNSYNAQIRTDGLVKFQLFTSSSPFIANVTNSNPVTAGAWYHLAFVKNGTNLLIYVNGVETTGGAATIPNLLTSGSNFLVGRDAAIANDFSGLMDEFSVWGTALSAAEIQTIFARQSARYSGAITS
jgi:hypothetical protein